MQLKEALALGFLWRFVGFNGRLTLLSNSALCSLLCANYSMMSASRRKTHPWHVCVNTFVLAALHEIGFMPNTYTAI
jgi:hypothetical protein